MQKQITTLIMKHLALLDKVHDTSYKLYHASANSNLNLVKFESDNRERLINILRNIQFKVEDEINNLAMSDITSELLEMLDCWKWDINISINNIDILDQKTMESLQEQKDETSCKIASIYKSREKFKGYNLKNLK